MWFLYILSGIVLAFVILVAFAPLIPGYAEEVQREEEDNDEANLWWR